MCVCVYRNTGTGRDSESSATPKEARKYTRGRSHKWPSTFFDASRFLLLSRGLKETHSRERRGEINVQWRRGDGGGGGRAKREETVVA